MKGEHSENNKRKTSVICLSMQVTFEASQSFMPMVWSQQGL